MDPFVTMKHGRPSTYKCGCRCDLCREANATMRAKARQRAGEGRKGGPAGKLTDDQVRAIRAGLESAAATAAQYGVSKTTIIRIRNREHYGYVA